MLTFWPFLVMVVKKNVFFTLIGLADSVDFFIQFQYPSVTHALYVSQVIFVISAEEYRTMTQ